MKKAVITGSTGSVGRAIIDKLVSENVEVTVLYHRGSKRIDGIPSKILNILSTPLSLPSEWAVENL